MPEANQTATPTDARQASMSRVQTQDTVLASLNPQKAASEPAKEQSDAEKDKSEGDQKPKRDPSARFQELANKRREAEEKAEAAQREAAELRAKLEALSTHAKPMAEEARPVRSAYANDDDYTDAVAEWKARRVLAKREEEQAQARAEAEQAERAQAWSKRQEAVMKVFPDYAEIVGKSEIQVAAHIHEAMLESEYGPQVAMYLAMNPDEAKRLNGMRQVQAIKRFRDIERDLADIDAEDAKPAAKEPVKETPKPQRSKAPEPIEPVRSVPSGGSSNATDYEEYKRRRQAEKGK